MIRASAAREAFRQGVALFDQQRFFEAHERFEEVWRSEEIADEDRAFWKGVTQVAVGCCHLQRGNARGAVALLTRAAGYLRPYPSPCCGVDTVGLLDLAQHLSRQVRASGGPAGIVVPPFPAPRIAP